MQNPTAAMLVIGDEILSGRTRDSNSHHLAGRLTEHGIDLREVRFIGDDADTISATVQTLADSHDHLFTSGGIGPTHDDITAEAVAAAFGTPISVRDDARKILTDYYAIREMELNEARLRMARVPDGATLIDNPVSAAPGFSLRNVHVMAGVPKIFEAMLDGLMPKLTGGAKLQSRTLMVNRGEGDIAEGLTRVDAAHPAVSVGSYPAWGNKGYQVSIVMRSNDPAALDAAIADARALFPEGLE